MKTMLDKALEIRQQILEDRRAIHRFAEVGPDLPRTKAYVMERLREMGYEPQALCQSGVVALAKGAQEGKTILLRADMDALPIREREEVEFPSCNGNMHACGHDMHTAMLLGAARLLSQELDGLEGAVKLVFQPDEEGLTGAQAMLEAGVLEEPKVDGAIALHVHSGTPSGQVLCGSGACMAGAVFFQIRVKGVACHGAMPETGVDPINIAAHIHLSLQEIVARENAPTSAVAVTIGKFAGGEVPNRIPQEVVMEGSVRALEQEVLEKGYRRVCEISAATAKSFGGEAVVTTLASVPVLINDPAMVREMKGYVEQLIPERPPVVYSGGGMGSDDFAAFLRHVPGVYLLLGAGTSAEDPRFGRPMHNEGVVFNEDVMPLGAAIYANCAVKWLKDHR